MYHISGLIVSLSPVNIPPMFSCTITMFLITYGGAARMVFTALFAIVVYIIKSNKESQKYTFVVLIAVVTLWVIAFLGASPLFSQDLVHTNYADSYSVVLNDLGWLSTFLVDYIYFYLFWFLSQ